MQSIIEEILYGNRGQIENLDYGKEYDRLSEEGLKIYDKFYPTLTKKQKKQFDNIFNVEAGQAAEAERAVYIEGFKIGFLIAVECFTK